MTDREKECLLKLLHLAKGNLSLDKFSEMTGISKFQLSRIMNGKFKETPRKSTLNAIAVHSQDSYAQEILLAYQSDSHTLIGEEGETIEVPTDNLEMIIELTEQHNRRKRGQALADKCKGIILKDSCSFQFDWTVKYLKADPFIPKALQPFLRIEIPFHESVDIWDFYFQPEAEQYEKGYLYTFLGRIMSSAIKPDHKVSLVITEKGLYEKLVNTPIQNMGTTFSFIFVDLENQLVQEEYYVSVNDNCKWQEIMDLVHVSCSEVRFPPSFNERIQ